MSRWGDNSAKGTRQKTGAAYVAGATGVGAGVAGAGYGVARAGQKAINQKTAHRDTYESLRLAGRQHSEKIAQAQRSHLHIIGSSKKTLENLENAPSGNRFMAAHTALRDLPFVANNQARAAARNEVRNAARSASFKRDRESASRAYNNLRSETTKLSALSGKYQRSYDAQRKLSGLRDAANQGIKAGKKTRFKGRAAMAAGAAIPLAALASAHRVSRDWAPASTGKPKRLRDVRPNTAYVAKPDKSVKLTSHQQALLNNSVQDKGWSISAAEKRHQVNRSMQKPEGGWR